MTKVPAGTSSRRKRTGYHSDNSLKKLVIDSLVSCAVPRKKLAAPRPGAPNAKGRGEGNLLSISVALRTGPRPRTTQHRHGSRRRRIRPVEATLHAERRRRGSQIKICKANTNFTTKPKLGTYTSSRKTNGGSFTALFTFNMSKDCQLTRSREL